MPIDKNQPTIRPLQKRTFKFIGETKVFIIVLAVLSQTLKCNIQKSMKVVFSKLLCLYKVEFKYFKFATSYMHVHIF
jgi:hypothetical protein